jgi:hypothetical protein
MFSSSIITVIIEGFGKLPVNEDRDVIHIPLHNVTFDVLMCARES